MQEPPDVIARSDRVIRAIALGLVLGVVLALARRGSRATR